MLCYYTYVFVSKWEIFIFDEGAAFQDSTKSITFITLAVTMWHWISLMDSSIHFYFSNYETYNFYGMYVHILELCSEILELLVVLQFFIYLMFIVWNRYTHYPATAYFYFMGSPYLRQSFCFFYFSLLYIHASFRIEKSIQHQSYRFERLSDNKVTSVWICVTNNNKWLKF